MEYKRESGSKCQLYELIGTEPEDGDYPNIAYGDIVYEKNGYRGTNAYVYTGDFECLSGMGPGNGSGGITKDISKYIENPITFYDMDDIYAGDIAQIELDIKAHMQLLREEAGNRDISDKFEFICEYYNRYPEINFESAKLYDGTTMQLTLTSELDDLYLTGDDFTDIDPITFEERKKKKENYIKNMSKVFQINNNVHYVLNTSNSINSGFTKISDIKYDDNNKPIEIIIENKYNFGIHGVEQTKFKFIPIDNDDGTPIWTCLELNITNDCKYIEYDEKTKKHKFSLTLSEYNFSDRDY
jgi:hypothetical protein